MTHNNQFKTISTLIMASTLFACGGGSGGSDNGGNGDNPKDIASKYSGKTASANLNDESTSTLVNGVYQESLFFIKDEINTTGIPVPVDSIPEGSDSGSCYSGTYNISNTLSNSATGTISVELNNCNVSNESSHKAIFNGKKTISYTTVDSDYNPYTYQLSFDNFTLSTESIYNNELITTSDFNHGTLAVTKEGDGRRFTSNMVERNTSNIIDRGSFMTKSFTIVESTNNGTKEYRLSGEYYDGVLGKVSISTLKPLTFDNYAQSLISGELELTGNNSTAKLIADNFSLSLHIDIDNDGIYDYDDYGFYFDTY